MFSLFAQNKARYKSGQIFPFLIAILCIVIIMVMITVNVGQLALFKTDVSNAADAGALSGISSLTGRLLGWGLQSDMMCGQNLIKLTAIILEIIYMPFPMNLITAIATLATVMSSNLSGMTKAGWDSQMAWTNARKTALQYAFNNAGVDEPRPTYEDFLAGSGESASEATYREYIAGESENSRDYARTGFAKFMSHPITGFWIEDEFGDPNDPQSIGLPIVTNGYGWGLDDAGEMTNSWDDHYINSYKACYSSKCWRDYDNWVEVTAESTRTMYLFDLVKLGIAQHIAAAGVWGFVFITRYPYWLGMCGWAGPLAPLIAGLFTTVEATISALIVEAVQFGMKFKDPVSDPRKGWEWQLRDSPLKVKVTRYKKGENLGMWNFRYGNPNAGVGKPLIAAESTARIYREKLNGRPSTIEPTLLNSDDVWGYIVTMLATPLDIMGIVNRWEDYFVTERHLFESGIEEIEWDDGMP